jgi:RHS repeat-associated protein
MHREVKRQSLNETGNWLKNFSQDPSLNQDRTHNRFHGEQRDQETGYYNYGYRYYLPELGKWPSRDPIEEMGGVNLYGMVGNDAKNRMDYLGQYTLTDAWESLINNRVKPQGPPDPLNTPGNGPNQYTPEQIFSQWYRLENADRGWLSTIPDCPDEICIINGKPKNCDSSKWHSLDNGYFVKKYHPGADYCMRSKGGPSGQQCCYKKASECALKLIKSGPDAGTPDRFAAGGIDHILHDVQPYDLAAYLGWTAAYLHVRPPSQGGGGCCK